MKVKVRVTILSDDEQYHSWGQVSFEELNDVKSHDFLALLFAMAKRDAQSWIGGPENGQQRRKEFSNES